jgi:hypothetical protein
MAASEQPSLDRPANSWPSDTTNLIFQLCSVLLKVSNVFTSLHYVAHNLTCRLQNNKILRFVPLEFSAKKLRGSFARFKNTPKAKKTKNSPEVLLLSQDESVGLLNTAATLHNIRNFSFCSTNLPCFSVTRNTRLGSLSEITYACS